MDWGKVIFIFFSLGSLTSTAGFLWDPNVVILFVALALNLISTTLKIGVKKTTRLRTSSKFSCGRFPSDPSFYLFAGI